jgi:hypothetical protein
MDTEMITKGFHVPKTWGSWLKSILAAFIAGFFNTIAAIVGPAVANTVGLQVQPFTLRQLLITAVSSGIVGVAMYLKTSPLPGTREDSDK